jgi:cytochrome c553
MNKINFILSVILVAAFVFGINACKKENAKVISSNSGTKSHNMGQNCLNCHKSGGEGKGVFKVAGTVYNAALNQTSSNGTVYLYSGSNGSGTLVATIEVDGKGNFFTTETVDFSSALYPVVMGSGQDKHYMGSSITDGACNSCHGVSTSKIWVN